MQVFLNLRPIWYVSLGRLEDSLDWLTSCPAGMIMVAVCPTQLLPVFGTRAEFLTMFGWPRFFLSALCPLCFLSFVLLAFSVPYYFGIVIFAML